MLFRSKDLDAIMAGTVGVAFRRWKRPAARAGSVVRTQRGLVAIDAVDQVDASTLSERDARDAGFTSLAALLSRLSGRDGECYRIRLHYVGPDTRPPLSDDANLSPSEREHLAKRLAALDGRSPTGAWTAATLRLIAEHPGRVAPELAAMAGRERDAFKADVRKLKALALTESLEVGYRLSPRGRAWLELP